jgi:two-component system NtrC family sensor kinase
MPRGGDIRIEAEMASPPDTLRCAPDARYLRLVVADTGTGMDEATLARAGEAFFTTKPRGEGTGLGLSMARGFAQHAGGTLELRSVIGEGTRVTVWLAPA